MVPSATAATMMSPVGPNPRLRRRRGIVRRPAALYRPALDRVSRAKREVSTKLPSEEGSVRQWPYQLDSEWVAWRDGLVLRSSADTSADLAACLDRGLNVTTKEADHLHVRVGERLTTSLTRPHAW
jgi:hypothetical protein